jgi:glycosyltransferase involved in cell wall biosynthesis
MKILIVALGLEPPWTEGRKNLVRDLIPLLNSYADIYIIASGQSDFCSKDYFSVPIKFCRYRGKASQLIFILLHFWNSIGVWRPDIVFHFPFGTFNGLRGVMNYAMLLCLRYVAWLKKKPCLTILYSMTNGSFNFLKRFANPCATVGVDGWDGYSINTGINTNREGRFQSINSKKLLFMAGYQDDNPHLLSSILHDRGLIDILKIGNQLAHHGFSLSIAIPLLRYSKRESELRVLLARYCCSLPVSLYTEESIYQLAESHSLFIFPYRKQHNVFVPTSVLEAMNIGFPVVISDLPMFHPLIKGNGQLAQTYEAGNMNALLETILCATADWEKTLNRAQQAKAHVEVHWSIEGTAQQLIAIANDILQPKKR